MIVDVGGYGKEESWNPFLSNTMTCTNNHISSVLREVSLYVYLGFDAEICSFLELKQANVPFAFLTIHS